jgi:uncharacterized membrane protein
MFDFYILITAIVFTLIDSIYLNFVGGYFKNQIKNVQGSPLKVNYLGVAVCYVFLVIGLYYFIIKPHKSASDAFLFGLVIYGVYETTNYALLSNWSIFTVFMDTLWGGILFALTTIVINKIKKIAF